MINHKSSLKFGNFSFSGRGLGLKNLKVETPARNRTTTPWFLTLFVCGTVSALLGCTGKKNENVILIGHYASMTGEQATFGQSTDKGLRLAIDEVNEKGGVLGKKIEIITMDNRSNQDETVTVVNRLIEQKKVVALVGEVASGRSLLAAPIAQNKKIPMISPSSTNPKVTQVGNYIFRTCFIDPFQGEVMAKFATETLKLKNVAVLREVSSEYSMGLADAFVEKFKAQGGKIGLDLSYTDKDVDYKAQLTQIRQSKPDGIFIPGYYSQVGLIARQARDLGITATLLGGDGWDSPKLSEIGKSAVDGSYFSNHYSNESDSPLVKDFIARYKAKYNEMPDGLSSVAYDAGKMLAQAISKTAQATPEQIRDQFAAIKDYDGVTGRITMDSQRNARKPAVVVKVSGTNTSYVSTVNP